MGCGIILAAVMFSQLEGPAARQDLNSQQVGLAIRLHQSIFDRGKTAKSPKITLYTVTNYTIIY